MPLWRGIVFRQVADSYQVPLHVKVSFTSRHSIFKAANPQRAQSQKHHTVIPLRRYTATMPQHRNSKTPPHKKAKTTAAVALSARITLLRNPAQNPLLRNPAQNPAQKSTRSPAPFAVGPRKRLAPWLFSGDAFALPPPFLPFIYVRL